MRPIDRAALSVWKKRIPFLAVLILCLASVPFLTRPPWFDEVLTLGWLTLGFAKIPFTYPIPNNHIVYTMLLSLWNSAGGALTDNWILLLRLLSLVTGGTALWLLSRILIRRGGLIAGAACSALLAVSGPMVLFSTALRGYAAALLFCIAAFLAAELWMKRKNVCSSAFFYLLFCYLAVGVMPTALFALLTGALFFLPALRDPEKRLRWCLLAVIPIFCVPLFYAHIFGKLVAASQLREGWTGYGAAYWNLYAAFGVSVLPLLAAASAGMWKLWKHQPPLRPRLLCFLLIAVMPLFLLIPANVPPFPRIFFPFFGIWSIILVIPAREYFRTAGRNGTVLFLLTALLWIFLAPTATPMVSRLLFGPAGTDDLLCPYPVSEEFIPMEAVKTIRENLPPDGAVFIDFDADPPSLRFILLNYGVPETAILYDRPDFGQVMRLPPGTLLVCRDRTDLEKLKQRFHLSGNPEPLLERGMQKVYRMK